MKKIKRTFRIFLILLLVVLLFGGIKFIDGYFSPRVKTYLEQKLIVVATDSVARSVENVINKTNIEEIITWKEKEKNAQIMINTNLVNNLLADVTTYMSKTFDINNQTHYLELPIGIIISETLFSRGPNIKIKAFSSGSFNVDVVSSVDEFGINNSMFRLDLLISIDYKILLPLASNTINVTTSVPIVMNMIQGDVPLVYGAGS